MTLAEQLGGARQAMRHRDVLGSISIGFVLFMLIFGLFLTTLPVHLEEDFGLGAGWRGLVIASPAITSTIAALRLGRLRARFGAPGLVVVSAALFTVAFLVMGVATTLPVLVAGAMLYGFGEGVCIPTLQDVVAGAAPAEQRGAVVAVWVGAARAGQTVGPLTAGVVYGATSTSATFLFGSGLAAAILVAQGVARFGATPEVVRR